MDTTSTDTSTSAKQSVSPAAKSPEPTESRALAVTIHRGILRLASGRIRDLKVEVLNETVVLQGRCGSYYCKQLAQHAAMELARDARVHNHIEVVG